MKKIYSSFLFLSVILFANATERTWLLSNGFATGNYSTTPLSAPVNYTTSLLTAQDPTTWTASLCTTSCTDGIEVCPNYRISSAAKPDPSTVYGTFGGKIQLSGFATTIVPPAIPTTSYLSFNVSGNATITIYCNPLLAGVKTLNIVNSAGNIVSTVSSSDVASSSNNNAEILTANYTGGNTKLTLYPTYSSSDNLLIYAITVVDNPATETYSAQAETKLKKVGSILQNEEAEDVVVYNLSGVKVLSSHETEIQISALPKGVYVANTAKGSMKFIK